ncbi:unnamed protein product [Adineta ricciae]|uniref:NHL repeat containing protein n=1 Tax=Adineta ricciae TaxID=249248 RepID=A0A815R573_ADIRI|nr:unnamed protein product [Adineta ricciae]
MKMKTNFISIRTDIPERSKYTKNNQHLRTTNSPKRVIHITVKPSRYNQFIGSRDISRSSRSDYSHRYKKDSTNNSQKNNNSFVPSNLQRQAHVMSKLRSDNLQTTLVNNNAPSTGTLRSVPLNSSDIKTTWANTTDYHYNGFHHNLDKKKKKKYRRSCFICSIILFLLLVTATIIALIVLLIKSKAKTNDKLYTNILRWNASGITIAGITGRSGANASQLNNPWGLALTYDRTLYVVDRFNHRIQRFSPNSTQATTVAGNGILSNTLNSLSYPTKIVLDSNDNLYIADGFNHRGLFWAKNSSSGVLIAGSGVAGSGLNQLNYYGNNRIMGYKPGNLTGFVVAGGNGQGSNYSQLNDPIAMDFDSVTNSFVIANFNRHNIVRWTLGANNWTLVAGDSNGLPGSTSTSLYLPTGLTLDPMGNLYVADLVNHRIQLFLNGEKNGTTIAGITGQAGNDSLSLNSPYTVVLDNQLNLYVADNQNHRIQKFMRY